VLAVVLALSVQETLWTERRLAVIPEDISGTREILFRSDGSAVVWAAKSRTTGTAAIWINEYPLARFDSVQRPVLSTDGRTLAYEAVRGLQWFVVAGDRLDPPFDRLTQPYINADGKVVAYRAHMGDKEVMVINGKAGEAFKKVHTPMFNPATQEVAYAAAREKGDVIVVGTDIRAAHDETWFPRWSPDGKTLAYGAKQDGASFVVIGDRKLKTYERVSGPKFAPDGRLATYTATHEGRGFVVVGETEFGPFDQPLAYAIDIAGKPFAIASGKIGEQRILWKGVAGPPFETVLTIGIDPQLRVTFEPVISPDQSHTAFRARSKGKWHVIHDDRISDGYDEIREPVFSHDSLRLAYVAISEKSFFVVVGKTQWGPFLFAGPPRFSSDDRKLAFGVRVAKEFWWKVVDLD
jgi:hypothetical protein